MATRKSESGTLRQTPKAARPARRPAVTAAPAVTGAAAALAVPMVAPAPDTTVLLTESLHSALRSIDRITAALPLAPAPLVDKAITAAPLVLEPSGAQWCARFPTSNSLDDLTEPFRTNASRFVAALRQAGATVSIAATYRPVERAWLMHWCFDVSHNQRDPRGVPPMLGVPIRWAHVDAQGAFDAVASRRAAEDMADTYRIAFMPALESRHTQRRAVDMTISWSGTLEIRAADGSNSIDRRTA